MSDLKTNNQKNNVNKKRKINPIQLFRHVIQIIAYITFPGLFVDTFRSMGLLVSTIIAGNWTMADNGLQTLLIVGLLIITALFGRFFCGFICSFGAMQDFLSFIGRKLRIKRVRVPHKVDKILKHAKYVILAVIAFFVWGGGIALFDSSYSPWQVMESFMSSGNPEFSVFASVGGILMGIIMVGSLFIDRFFCRYFCPLGAIFAITSRLRIFKIKKPTAKCGNCKACSNACPMNVNMKVYEAVNSGECIDCMRCKGTCPSKNISFGIDK
ncbi:MAG: 4Fe-4S binding protein [Pseudobutyrivibrio sp.]|nr:4Fe-4S binding protein [Pseudobutyrivibrio sp.]